MPAFAHTLRRRCALLVCIALLNPCAARADDIVVIVNKDNPNSIDRAFVERLYTGAIKGWPDGSPAFVLDLAENDPARALFSTRVLGRSLANMRAIWSQNIFTGKGLPPRVVSPDAEMKRLVATNRNAIGYIRASQLDDSVRAVRD
ncbi:MAG: substrate-binding domain-containing protein [Leptothrix sp. (in: b-proteobacteria)]